MVTTTATTPSFICAAATLLILTGHLPFINGSGWKYEDEAHWSPFCHEGKHQSPIALSPDIATTQHFPAFILNGAYSQKLSTIMKNNGHSAEVRPEPNQPIPEIHGGGLHQIYQLDHLHFHWQSEHTIMGYRFPLELHLVHYAKNHGNLTNALKHTHGVAVLGVLFDISPDDDDEFIPLLEIVEILKDQVNLPNRLSAFSIKSFLPRDMSGFYRYDGSLTTPGCNEGIVWTVFTNTVPISEKQVKVFEELQTDEHTVLKHNFRSLQPANNRKVFLKVSPIRPHSSIATTLAPQLVLPIAISVILSILISSLAMLQ